MHARKHMMLVAFICSSCTTESNLEFTGPPPIEFTVTSRPGALDFRWGQSTGALNYRICTTAAACAAPGEPQQDTDAPILTYADCDVRIASTQTHTLPRPRYMVLAESYCVRPCSHTGHCRSMPAVALLDTLDNVEIRRPTGEAAQSFGRSVALSNGPDTLVIGASLRDDADAGLSQAGAVWVYAWNGEASDWGPPQPIMGEHDHGWFGQALSLSADGLTLAVGASGADDHVGRVRVFSRDTTEQAFDEGTDVTVDMSEPQQFGRAVALTTNALIVGAPWHMQGQGAVYVCALDSQSCDAPALLGVFGGLYGRVVAGSSSSDRFVVGSSLDPSAEHEETGAIYLDGQSRTQPVPAQAQQWFGAGVALSSNGSLLAVGAPGQDGGKGAVHLFDVTSDGAEPLHTFAPDVLDDDDRFGTSVALSSWDDRPILIVGAPQVDGSLDPGVVHAWQRRETGDWDPHPTVTLDQDARSNADADDGFGVSLAVAPDGSALAVGSRVETVYVY